METITQEKAQATNWQQLATQLEYTFYKRASDYDQTDRFVKENYDDLKENHFFTAMIPKELGGFGISHADMCNIIRTLAHGCSSTALALSMHQHLLAANIWKYKKGKGGEAVLKKVADNNLILISTGAGDWLASSGEMKKVDGGYRVSATKHFASQAVIGNVLVSSARYQHSEKGWQVLHFSVPMKEQGITVMDNWHTLGMRGTGSHSVQLENVFVPDAAIVLERPQGEYHSVWNVVLVVAMPLIMSAYVGVAEKAAEIAISMAKKQNKPNMALMIGELNNELTLSQVLLKDMIGLTNNFDFEAINQNGSAMLTRKTLVANACIRTVQKAMEVVGGPSFFRNMDLERLFRDVQGGVFHPLPEKPQQQLCGEWILAG